MPAFDLPYPDRILWPNGRGHHMARHKAFKKHKHWGFCGALHACGRDCRAGSEARIDWSVTFHPKTRNPVDDDNARASLKAYQDGFALALGVDDKLFNSPTVTFGEPVKGGLLRIEIDPA